MTKQARLILVLDVLYDLNGTDFNTLHDHLQFIAGHAAVKGLMTGESEAEVDTWESHVVERTDNLPLTSAGLLAAAPDLLAALEAAEAALRSYQYGNSATDLAREVADNAQAAIVKAKGG